VAFRKRVCTGIERLETDLCAWLTSYNAQQPHQGRWRFGETDAELR
jgi:hypothetical protein